MDRIITLNDSWKGSEPEWSNPKIKYWKLHELHKNGVKRYALGIERMTEILKFLKFQQLLKHVHFNSILKFRGASSMFVG